MEDKMICGLIWLFTLLITAVVLLIIGFLNYRKWKVMKDTPSRMIVDIEPGRVEVNGRIEAVPGGWFYSPVTKIPCVQYDIKVQEYRSTGKSGHWATIHKVKRGSPFLIVDESGKVLVDPSGVKLKSIRTMSTQTGLFNEMDSRARQYIQELGMSERGFFGVFKRKLRVMESVIPVDRMLYAIGDAVDDPAYRNYQNDPLTSPFTIKKRGMMILSLKSEKELSNRKMITWLLLYIFSGLSIFLGIIGTIYLLFGTA